MTSGPAPATHCTMVLVISRFDGSVTISTAEPRVRMRHLRKSRVCTRRAGLSSVDQTSLGVAANTGSPNPSACSSYHAAKAAKASSRSSAGPSSAALNPRKSDPRAAPRPADEARSKPSSASRAFSWSPSHPRPCVSAPTSNQARTTSRWSVPDGVTTVYANIVSSAQTARSAAIIQRIGSFLLHIGWGGWEDGGVGRQIGPSAGSLRLSSNPPLCPASTARSAPNRAQHPIRYRRQARRLTWRPERRAPRAAEAQGR